MCIFCKIVDGDIPSNKVYEDEQILVFKDVNPTAPTHLLVIPKKHIASLDAAEQADLELLGRLQLTAAEIARQQGIAKDGYRLVLNCGEQGGQTVDHLHYHLIGGQMLGWPPFTDVAK